LADSHGKTRTGSVIGEEAACIRERLAWLIADNFNRKVEEVE
jgi:hypothetical protein